MRILLPHLLTLLLCTGLQGSESQTQPMSHPFIDCPDLAGVMSGEFRVLSAAEVEAGVSPAMLVHLGGSELEQLRYWKPERMGDVIFNHWD